MSDNRPPVSQSEQHQLLSAYMEGILAQEEKQQVERWLETDILFRNTYYQLQAVDASVSQLASSTGDALEGTSLWDQISVQLNVDQQAEPDDSFDVEFISAYYDGEISREEPDYARFEAQLYGNVVHNQLLADIGEVSEAVRNFAYRLEEAVQIDVVDNVMNRYLQESGLAQPAEDLPELTDPVYLDLSAFVDQELPAKEVIHLNGLLETNEEYRQALGDFAALSEAIQAVSDQIGERTPDFWPAIEQKLAETENVVNIHRSPSRFRKFIPASIAAAVLILAFSFPMLQNPTAIVSEQSADSPEVASSLEGASAAEIHGAIGSDDVVPAQAIETGGGTNHSYELAAAPAPVMTHAQFVRDAVPETGLAERALPGRMKEKKLSAFAGAKAPQEKTEAAALPSSESYLLRSLQQEMSDDEIQVILGL